MIYDTSEYSDVYYCILGSITLEPPHESSSNRGFEPCLSRGKLRTAKESMWFCWETSMTIGLGDLIPQTDTGRLSVVTVDWWWDEKFWLCRCPGLSPSSPLQFNCDSLYDHFELGFVLPVIHVKHVGSWHVNVNINMIKTCILGTGWSVQSSL